MKRVPIALIVLLLVCSSARAADVDTVLSGLQAYWRTIDTFTAGFVQKKHLALLSGDVTSRGDFTFKKPGNMVFRYNPPEDTIIEIKPGLITYYFPKLKKAKRIHLAAGPDVPQWMSFGLGPINDTTAFKKNFTVSTDDTNGVIVMKLVPKALDGAIKEIVVSFRNDYTPLSTVILERTGDSTTLEFSNQKVNVPLDKALFDVKIPSGVAIDEIGK